jgi:hypothetical protein
LIAPNACIRIIKHTPVTSPCVSPLNNVITENDVTFSPFSRNDRTLSKVMRDEIIVNHSCVAAAYSRAVLTLLQKQCKGKD